MEQYILTEREQNKLQILHQLMEYDEISASVVSERTHLSAATVSRVFKEFRDKDLISFQGKVKTNKGRNPDLYTFNREYGFLVHYYVTNKMICGYLADLSGAILKKVCINYTDQDTLDDFFSIIKSLKEKFDTIIQRKKGRILAAGFSIPGAVNEDNRTVYTVPDVYQLNNIKFFDYAEHVLDVPIIANNVSWLSAVGEKTRHYPFANSLIYVVFTHLVGVGAGIIYQNELLKGGMHYAGEVGQTWFNHNVSLEDYIRGVGSYEQMASIQHLFESVEQVMKDGRASILSSILHQAPSQKLTLALLEEAAEQGDQDIVALLDESIRMWACLIINLNLIINPEFVVLGGSLSVENKYIFRILTKYLNKIKQFQPHVQFSISGEDAQLYGGLHMLKEYVNQSIIFKEAMR